VISNTVLVAPDAFKGTLSASKVAGAIGRGLRADGRLQVDLCPVADGGEESTRILIQALGGTIQSARVRDPLGRVRSAEYGLLEDGETAIVEVAQASGLARVAAHELDARGASSEGTGELILAALASGVSSVLVAAGGAASTDGGSGAIDAIKRGGGLGGAALVVLCDVRIPFEQAARCYGPQKGADEATVRALHTRLMRLARRLPRDPRGLPMTGAAGGLAGGLWASFGARLCPGAPYLLDALDFDVRMRRARAVILGEGSLDRGTLHGKAPFEIATRARQAGVPAYAIVARDALCPFDARILDLQVILEAGDERALQSAGRKLAGLI
jgi:glycerate kinase